MERQEEEGVRRGEEREGGEERGGQEGGGRGAAALAIFSCTMRRGIIVPWITSIAGDNRQAAERSG